MVKVAHAVHAVVAADAVHAVFFQVCRHIFMVVFHVAGQAVQGLSSEAFLAVAAFAAHAVALVVFLVFDQAEVRQFGMVHVVEGPFGDDHFTSVVFRVAGLAFFGAGQFAVQAFRDGSLLGDFGMAVLAFGVRHAVQGGMAVLAFLFEFSMRDIPV